MTGSFNFEKRKYLEECLRKRVTIPRIAEALKVSRQTVYNEVRKGVDEEDYKLHIYENYQAERAQRVVEEKMVERIR